MYAPNYYVYILTNKRRTVLYTGVAGDICRRIDEHKQKLTPGFATKYNVDQLVYLEIFEEPNSAILREKQIKGGSRQRKIDLIRSMNPDWRDLSVDL